MKADSGSGSRYWPIAIAISSRRESRPFESSTTADGRSGWLWMDVVTMAAIFSVLALMSATGVPGVNETHYLTKAKHFWNPEWCGRDLFLSSSDAHYAFFLLFGWPTTFLDLEVYAWVGRVVCWLAMAWAWMKLNRTFGIANWLMPFTAALMLLLNNNFDMAGEWVVGGFEAKSVAYVFVVLALDCFLRQRWNPFWLYLGLGCLFHLVIGVWALVCFAAVRVFSANRAQGGRRPSFENTPGMFWLFLVFCIAAVIPAVATDVATSGETVTRGNAIQVHTRLAHHLLFGSFPTIQIARFVLIVMVWSFSSIYALALVSNRARFFSFRRFCHFSLFISLSGLMLSAIAEQQTVGQHLSNALLKFYWFRFADFAIPLGLAMVCGIACTAILTSSARSRKISCWTALTAIALAAIFSTVQLWLDPRPPAAQVSLPNYQEDKQRTRQSFANFVKACHWADGHTGKDAIFVTPYHQQIFKWYSNRAEFVCWKDAPQDAHGIVEWKTRIDWLSSFDRLPGGILQLDAHQAQALHQRAGATHVLAAQALEDAAIDRDALSANLRRVYPVEPGIRSTYVIYEIVLD